MGVTLLNKLVLIFVLFLIGLTFIESFKVLTPKIIEGNTVGPLNVEANIHKHAGEIALLQEQIKELSDIKYEFKELKKNNKHNSEQILGLTKSNAANAASQSLKPPDTD